jgi:hypothetical protein
LLPSKEVSIVICAFMRDAVNKSNIIRKNFIKKIILKMREIQENKVEDR